MDHSFTPSELVVLSAEPNWAQEQPQRRSHAALDEDIVLLRRQGEELHVVLNSPGNRNALSAAMRDALAAAFRLPEVGMGLIPGAGGCVSIPRRIGRQRTAHMAILGEAIGAEQALAWGLIDAIEE